MHAIPLMNTNKILAVIVLYGENVFLSKSYLTMIQPNRLPFFVYDNSPLPMHSYKEFYHSGIYVHDSSNAGISKAYNCAAAYASENDFEWLLLLDQDTFFPSSTLEKYVEAILEYQNIQLLAPKISIDSRRYISPVPVWMHISRISRYAPTGIIDIEKYSLINSGLLVNLKAFFSVGGYNENVKLDFSDHQFINRFKKRFSECFIIDAVVIQDFSNTTQSKSQKLGRFDLFCDSILNCERFNHYDGVIYHLLLLKRLLSLVARTKSLIPFKIWAKRIMIFYKNEHK